MAETLTGLRKAAVLLVQMGRQRSAAVLEKLQDSEVEELTSEILRLGRVDQDIADQVLTEFHDLTSPQRKKTRGGLDYARQLLVDTLGVDKADEILSRLTATMSDLPFSFLQDADPRQVLSFLQDEHPQTTALILAHLPAGQASLILSGLTGEVQTDVAHRIAMMDRTSPDIIREVEGMLKRKLSTVLQPSDLSTVGGLQPLVDIINRTDRTTERLILEGLESRNPELADQVRSQMFMFEDLVALEDKAVQLVLRQVEGGDLANALKGVRADVREKIMSNMSERARENLGDEIDMLGAVRLRTVEEAQAKILSAVRTLEASGQIMVRRGDEDEYVS
ncbi:MAG TPA: flagellar motor switch protein FliG [Mycobacteriales bacterium]|nr:flagellar motor switch protein FliG [Mycobacteriales bacterium]